MANPWCLLHNGERYHQSKYFGCVASPCRSAGRAAQQKTRAVPQRTTKTCTALIAQHTRLEILVHNLDHPDMHCRQVFGGGAAVRELEREPAGGDVATLHEWCFGNAALGLRIPVRSALHGCLTALERVCEMECASRRACSLKGCSPAIFTRKCRGRWGSPRTRARSSGESGDPW